MTCLDCAKNFEQCECRTGTEKIEYFRERSLIMLRLAEAVERGEPFFVRFAGRDLPAKGTVDRKADKLIQFCAEFLNISGSAVADSKAWLVSAEGELVSVCVLNRPITLWPGDKLNATWNFYIDREQDPAIFINEGYCA